jgi:hypothetical protein
MMTWAYLSSVILLVLLGARYLWQLARTRGYRHIAWALILTFVGSIGLAVSEQVLNISPETLEPVGPGLWAALFLYLVVAMIVAGIVARRRRHADEVDEALSRSRDEGDADTVPLSPDTDERLRLFLDEMDHVIEQPSQESRTVRHKTAF